MDSSDITNRSTLLYLQHRYHSSMIELPVGRRSADDDQGSCEKENCSVKKGLLWQQRDRLFSRWKERFFVLTRDYLICFHKASRGIASSEMGSFIFKISLNEVDTVEREDRKGGPIVVMLMEREGKLYLRCKNGIEDWLKALKETVRASKGRREALRHTLTRDFPSQMLDGLQNFRAKLPLQHTLSDSQQEAARVNRAVAQEMQGHMRPVDQHLGTPRASRNRLSLMTDIDFDSSTLADTETPPSTPSFKMSNKATPTSTPHGSLYHSRSSSRMSSEHFNYYDEGSPLAAVQVRHKEPSSEHYLRSNGTASTYASSSHIHVNGHDKIHYASNSSTATRSSMSSGSPRGLVNGNGMHYYANGNGNHQRSASSHQHYYQQNDNWERQIHHNSSPKHERLSNGVMYSINPRRFSLASASEVHNGSEHSHWNNNVSKTNRNISRVASDRHTTGRPNTPDHFNLHREHSGSDSGHNDHSLRKRWGMNQEIHASESVATPSRHPIGIFTHL